MSIHIGDKNRIKNSVIAESANGKSAPKSWSERHPILVSVLVSLGVGFLLLFHFWDKLVTLIEGLF